MARALGPISHNSCNLLGTLGLVSTRTPHHPLAKEKEIEQARESVPELIVGVAQGAIRKEHYPGSEIILDCGFSSKQLHPTLLVLYFL
jgi:hypothetical protein